MYKVPAPEVRVCLCRDPKSGSKVEIQNFHKKVLEVVSEIHLCIRSRAAARRRRCDLI